MERIAFLLLFSLILMEGRGQAVSETAAYYDSLAESELGKGNIETRIGRLNVAFIWAIILMRSVNMIRLFIT